MPKVNPDQSIGLVPTDGRRRAPGVVADRAAASKSASRNDAGRTKRRSGGTPTLAALMMEEAQAAAAAKKGGVERGSHAPAETPLKAVSIRGMVGPRQGGLVVDTADAPQLSEVVSSAKRATPGGSIAGNDNFATATSTSTSGAEKKPSEEPSAGLPAPPLKTAGTASWNSSGRRTSKGAVVPPAPPSGNSIFVSGAEVEGTGVVWPRGSEKDEEEEQEDAVAGWSRLDELD
ncbi:unnamed protein product [Pylaiella littoralis]